MEASQTGATDPQDQPTTPSEPTTAPDTGLQTPLPDQSLPTDPQDQPTTPSEQATDAQSESSGFTGEVGPSGQPAEGTVEAPSYPTNADQEQAHAERQSERAVQRQEHNERTGGGTVHEGEVQAQRDEHNARVAGEQVSPESDPKPSEPSETEQTGNDVTQDQA